MWFATKLSGRPYIFQTMKSVRSKYLSLKYQMFTPSGYKDIEIRKFEFVAKIQFLTRHEFFYGKRKSFGPRTCGTRLFVTNS